MTRVDHGNPRGWTSTVPEGPAPVALRRQTGLHLHRYRRIGDDSFSGASLYACRCGVVRPGM